MGDLDIGGRIVLKWILSKKDWRVWTGLMWLRKGQGTGAETGISLSNLAFPVSINPEKIKVEQECDVCHAVRTVHQNRVICAKCCIIRHFTVHCQTSTSWNVCISNPLCLLCFLGVLITKIITTLKHAFWLHFTRTVLCYGMEPYTNILPRLLNIQLIDSSPLSFFNHPHMA